MADPSTTPAPLGDGPDTLDSYAMALGRLEYAALAVVELYDLETSEGHTIEQWGEAWRVRIDRLRQTLAQIDRDFPLDRHMTS